MLVDFEQKFHEPIYYFQNAICVDFLFSKYAFWNVTSGTDLFLFMFQIIKEASFSGADIENLDFPVL